MTSARHPRAGSTASLSARLTLACALTAACGMAFAASIDDLPASGYDPFATENSFEVQRLDGGSANDRLPVRKDEDVEQVLRSLQMPRPDLQDEEPWYNYASTQPLALQPETLLRGVDDDIWLSEQGTTRRVEDGPGLRDVLRSILNVGFDDASMQPDADPQATAPSKRGNRGTGSDLLRDFVASTIEPYRRADGTVGFSVLGVGDFYAEADRSLRGVRLVEESTGWSFGFSEPAEPAPTRQHGATDAPRQAVMLPADAAPVAASDVHIGEKLRALGRWFRDSLLVKFFLVVWTLVFIIGSLLRLGRSLKSKRRAKARVETARAESNAVSGLATPPPALAQQQGVHRRRRRRRSRSPTLRNLLRSLGLR